MASTVSKIAEKAARLAEDSRIENAENIPIFKFLYHHKPDSTIETTIQKLERFTRLQREQLLCLIVASLLAYFLISSFPRFACSLIGVCFPLYASIKAIHGEDDALRKSWLVYWVVFAAFSSLDLFLERIFATFIVYWLSKIVFLFYLIGTQPFGSEELLEKVVTPAGAKLESLVSTLLDTFIRAPRANNKSKKLKK